jgi:ribosomal protein S27E
MADPADAPQRFYRAPCPGCGAPVEFRSAQSTHAVCGYCHTTVAREGDTLKRLGKLAELFDDFSPLQIGTTGRYGQRGFTLVGRLQYGYSQGRWTEWIAAFDDGAASGSLSEDNGAFVFALPTSTAIPAASTLRVGMTAALGGQRYTVSSSEQAALVSAQGELPRLPPLNHPFAVVELRSEQGQVLSFDYGSDPPTAWLGNPVRLDDLQLRGLRDESARNEQGRSFNCPNCGAPVAVQLENTQSITCGACGSIIDISNGIGGELRHAAQDEPVRPLIALGSVGQLQGAAWQVVGFQHRMGQEPGDDESFGWQEYLLYNKTRGFSFLVDDSEGWSLVAPITGVPTVTGPVATYLGKPFRLDSSYTATTDYVAGEFYWRVERGQTTQNKDFKSIGIIDIIGGNLLSLEVSPNEQVWSYGGKIDSRLVAAAFRLDPSKLGQLQRADAQPLGARLGTNIVFWIIVLIVVVMLLNQCSGGAGGSYGGGSYGGYSSGGSHK